MYKFVTAHCLSRTVGSQWNTLDISNSLVSAVFNTFREVYLVINDSFIDKDVYVNIDSFRTAYSGMNVTIKEMLDRHEGLPLETVESLPNMSVKYARYSIGNKVGYTFKFVKAGYNYSYDSASDILSDLKITRPGFDTDMKDIHKYCLVTVNGYIHDTDADNGAAYALDGAKSMRIANDNRFGILSFIDIGELSKIKLKKENIYPTRVDGFLKEKITFTIDEDIEDDCFVLVLGGYLVFPEKDIFWKQGTNSYTLDINRLPYVERIFESREFIDISGLDIAIPGVNEEAMEVSDIYSDKVIKNYLTMSQSFFVRIKAKNLGTAKYGINKINTPGSFILYQEPTMPMFVSHGRLVEYWSQRQGERYHVAVPDSYFRNYSIRYRYKKDVQCIDNTLMAENPIHHEGGLMLEISSYKDN